MNGWLKKLGLALLLIAAGSTTVLAQQGQWVRADSASVRLVSAVMGVGQSETLPLGLEFRLDPGWKIYWRSPGDAGLPPIPDWSASQNVGSATLEWPVPERFMFFDLGTLGYSDTVLFPLSVTPQRVGEPVNLAGIVDYLICAEICIPGRAELSLTIPDGPADLSPDAHLIDQARALVPRPQSDAAGLAVQQVSLIPQRDGTSRLSLDVESPSVDFTALDAIVEGPGGAYFDAPNLTSNGGRAASLELVIPASMDSAALLSDGVTVTLIDGQRAVETHTTVIQGVASGPSLWTMLGLALIGGLILNLMPCVLPVLSLKLMSVLNKTGKGRSAIRAGFLASSAGIILSFLVLAGGAIGLQQAGLSVGWGIQFQQPVFLALMVALLTLFACNMAGLFEFQLPAGLVNRAAQAGGDRDGLFRDFLTGAFATLLATPCSAPFLGTAVGFALGTGPFEVLSIFLALGLGLSLPYLLIAVFPGLTFLLPRPGRWMIYLKAVLTLALIGTSIWLLTVLSVAVGTENALAVGGLVVVAAAVLVARKVEGSRLGRAAFPVSAALALAAVLSPLTFEGGNPIASEREVSEERIHWVPFDEAAIPALVAQGKTVFVDVTADWCVTCQWNKKAVLETDSILAWLNSETVVAMKADWTLPDPKISDYLTRHGRYGIPFNIVYGPSLPSGIALSELLSADDVRAAALSANPDTRIADGG